MKRLFGLLLLPALLAGCTSTITNLTPSRYPRDPAGYYRVEAEWFTRRQAVRPDTIQPQVVVGFTNYPMRAVSVVSDRWEAFIPVPANTNLVVYHYKFDFLDNNFGGPKPNSMLSRDYELRLSDK